MPLIRTTKSDVPSTPSPTAAVKSASPVGCNCTPAPPKTPPLLHPAVQVLPAHGLALRKANDTSARHCSLLEASMQPETPPRRTPSLRQPRDSVPQPVSPSSPKAGHSAQGWRPNRSLLNLRRLHRWLQ